MCVGMENGASRIGRGRIFALASGHDLQRKVRIDRAGGTRPERDVLQLVMRLRGNYPALSRTMLDGQDRGVADHHSAQLVLWRRRPCDASGGVISAARGDCAQRGKAEWR
jgi:hypothetical protein